ncbi:molybdate ABC transporter substrate-binding protein [Shewanella waksmanii]|uniref:molybdate ABC transporter substrate-binding protein n=1 Tax=Shewanella waksmanii TaxID=213783 RepID=UPI0004AFEEE1|nr:molybdate ABC transporter substrate-binding protein [Shewanella waksmanii]
MKSWMIVGLLACPAMAHAAELEFRAAGSLKTAMSEVIGQYQQQVNVDINAQFAPSGLLRKRIEQGEQVDLYASANMKHPNTLHAANQAGPVVEFAGNNLCALAQQSVEVDSNNLLAVMLNQKIRLGTSTPKADPAGDYAWQLFNRAESVQQGAEAALQSKALQLTGGENSAKPPKGRNPYGWVMGEQQADLFLTYCTNAVLAQKEVPSLKIIKVPSELAVGATYGLTLVNDYHKEAAGLAMFILSSQGQAILAKYGFETRAE